jgi:hypothetical protein
MAWSKELRVVMQWYTGECPFMGQCWVKNVLQSWRFLKVNPPNETSTFLSMAKMAAFTALSSEWNKVRGVESLVHRGGVVYQRGVSRNLLHHRYDL